MRQYGQQFIEAGRGAEIDLGATHHEGDPRLQQDILLDVAGAQELGASPFHKLEIIGVVDDASGVCVFVVDTYRKLRDFPHKNL